MSYSYLLVEYQLHQMIESISLLEQLFFIPYFLNLYMCPQVFPIPVDIERLLYLKLDIIIKPNILS